MLKIGVSTNNDCGKSDEEMIINLKNAGFERVMLAHRKNNSELVELINKLGLKTDYYHLGTFNSNVLWAKGAVAEKYVNDIIEQIRFCGKHNIKVAVLHVVDGTVFNLPLPPNSRGVANLNRMLAVAKEVGVKIALENLGSHSIKYIDYLFKRIKDDNLGFCYDVGHHHIYSKKLDLLKKYGHKLIAVHLHDNLCDYEFGFDYSRDLHYLPFDGKIDFDKVAANFRKLNYDGIVMLELHKAPTGGPHLYKDMDNLEFLKQAKKRAERLADMIEGKND